MTYDERWIHLTANKETTKANPTIRWLLTSLGPKTPKYRQEGKLCGPLSRTGRPKG
jgi:hypothetical protein